MTRVLLVLLLVAAIGAVAWFVVLSPGPAAEVRESEGSALPRSVGETPLPPAARPRAAREGILDDAETLKVPDGVPDRSRISITGVADDGLATGEQIRAALLEAPGLFLRWESEAAKESFLGAKIRVPAPAYMPREGPLGVPVTVVVASVKASGYRATFDAPRVVIGPKERP